MENDILFLTSEKTKSKFNGTSAVDFPELPTVSEDAQGIMVDPREFAQAIAIVSFASATDDSKPIFYRNIVELCR
jgi:DNA polymerase III sliding clamp (beta) subunit (PCNA family)